MAYLLEMSINVAFSTEKKGHQLYDMNVIVT